VRARVGPTLRIAEEGTTGGPGRLQLDFGRWSGAAPCRRVDRPRGRRHACPVRRGSLAEPGRPPAVASGVRRWAQPTCAETAKPPTWTLRATGDPRSFPLRRRHSARGARVSVRSRDRRRPAGRRGDRCRAGDQRPRPLALAGSVGESRAGFRALFFARDFLPPLILLAVSDCPATAPSSATARPRNRAREHRPGGLRERGSGLRVCARRREASLPWCWGGRHTKSSGDPSR
jgi:hypothetical protein